MHQCAMPGQLEVHADMRNKKSNNIVALCEPRLYIDGFVLMFLNELLYSMSYFELCYQRPISGSFEVRG